MNDSFQQYHFMNQPQSNQNHQQRQQQQQRLSLASAPSSLGNILNENNSPYETPNLKSNYQLPSLNTLLSSIQTIHTPLSRTLPYPQNQQVNYYLPPTHFPESFTTSTLPQLSKTPKSLIGQRQQQQVQQPLGADVEYYTPSGNPRKHICKTCEKGFTTSGHLARHNRIHTGIKNHVCSFPGCEARFSRHDNCMQHYKTHLKSKKGQRKVRL